jgi:hypothetical protein
LGRVSSVRLVEVVFLYGMANVLMILIFALNVTNLRLCDIVENEVLNFNILYTQLHPFYQDYIHSINIGHDIDDKLIWRCSPNGI